MSGSYAVVYAPQAFEDLRDIASYLTFTLHAPDTAKRLTGRIRKQIRELGHLPARHPAVEWEPWHSMNLRHVSVGNFVVFYRVEEDAQTVTVVRIVYGGRDLEQLFPQ